jgi:DNA polymerase-3 subunit epsilon
MRHPAYRTIQRSMIGAGVCAGIGAVLILPHVLTGRSQDTVSIALIAGSWLVAILLLVRVWRAARRLGRGIETLRAGVLNLVADREAILSPDLVAGAPPEVAAMLGSLALYQDAIDRERRGPDRRLIAVLGSMSCGVVLITEQGQVSLINGVARELLGAERARVGTSLFAALSRESVTAAVQRVARAGAAREALFERLDGVKLQGRIASLPDDEGAVIIFPPVELEQHRPGLDFDLALHDVPPAPTASWTPRPPGWRWRPTASSPSAPCAPTGRGSSRAACSTTWSIRACPSRRPPRASTASPTRWSPGPGPSPRSTPTWPAWPGTG